jgi:hypothetical protein
MEHGLLVVASILALLVAGCGEDKPDRQAEFDRKVEEQLPQYKRIDAVQFFEDGGSFWNLDIEGEAPVDQECVLPLVKALSTEANVKAEVLVSTKDEGFALRLLVPLPKDEETRSRVDSIIAKADEAFAGAIIPQRGNDWLGLDFLAADEVELVNRKAGREVFKK